MQKKLNTIQSRIDDLPQELKDNAVSKSRHKDIINIFNKVLGPGLYYNVSLTNPAMNEFEVAGYKERPENLAKDANHSLKTPYKCYTGSSAYVLYGQVLKIDGHYIKTIKQELVVKTLEDFRYRNNYIVYYFACDDIDKIR